MHAAGGVLQFAAGTVTRVRTFRDYGERHHGNGMQNATRFCYDNDVRVPAVEDATPRRPRVLATRGRPVEIVAAGLSVL